MQSWGRLSRDFYRVPIAGALEAAQIFMGNDTSTVVLTQGSVIV